MKKDNDSEIRIKQKVGNVVRQARIDAGLSPKEFSEKTDFALNDVSSIENGNRNLTIGTLNRISEALNSDLQISFIPNL